MKHALLILSASFLLLQLCSCRSTQEQAIRHATIAALIEQEDVDEQRIEIQNIQVDHLQAVVIAKVLEESSRASAHRLVRCELSHETGRWTITKITGQSEEPPNSVR